MNHSSVIGRLTKDPELKPLADGTNVCKLRLAVDRMGGGEDTGYINVAVFGKSGEAAARELSKGWLVGASGKLQYSEWEKDGVRHHDYEIVGNVDFLVRPRGTSEQNGAHADEPEEAIAF
jgi:single-strand DNA-binding protein